MNNLVLHNRKRLAESTFKPQSESAADTTMRGKSKGRLCAALLGLLSCLLFFGAGNEASGTVLIKQAAPETARPVFIAQPPGEVSTSGNLPIKHIPGFGDLQDKPWKKWAKHPVNVRVSFQGFVKAFELSSFSISLANTNYNGTGVSCDTNVETGVITVELQAFREYTLSFSGDTASSVRVDFDEPEMVSLYEDGLYKSSRAKNYAVFIDKEERTSAFGQNPSGCDAFEKTWKIEVKPTELDFMDYGVVPENEAPGDAGFPEIGPGKSENAFEGAIAWSVGLGRKLNGRSAGRIRLLETEITTNLFDPSILLYTPPSTNDVDIEVILDDDDVPRQLRTPQGFVDIVTTNVLSDQQFDIRFHQLGNVSTTTNSNGFYEVTNDDPFVVWRFQNPDTNQTTRLHLLEIRNGITNVAEIEYDSTNTIWSLTYGSGNEQRIETRAVDVQGTQREETHTIRDGGGAVAYKAVETYEKIIFDWVVKEIVTDPDGDALTTTFTYYDDPGDGILYGFLRHIAYPDGSWEARDYAYGGQLKPYKDSPADPNDADYANSLLTTQQVLSEDGDGIKTSWIDQVMYHPFDSLTAVISTEEYDRQYFGETAEFDGVVDLVFRNEGWWFDYRDVKGEFNRGASNLWQGLPYCDIKLHGPQTSFTYQCGTFNSSNSTFTVNNTGSAFLKIAVHGADVEDSEVTEWTNSVWASEIVVNGATNYFELITASTNQATMTFTYLEEGVAIQEDTYVITDVSHPRIENWELIDRKVMGRDGLGHLVSVARVDPTSDEELTLYTADWAATNAHPGPLKLYEVDEAGIRHDFKYDSLKRMVKKTREGTDGSSGFPAQTDTETTNAYDAQNNVIRTIVSSGSLSRTNSITYDPSGRMTSQTGPEGTTTFSYDGLKTVTTYPGGKTRIEEKYLDGRPKSITGTGQIHQFFDYEVPWDPADIDGMFQFETNRIGRADSKRWTAKTYFGQEGNYVYDEFKPLFNNTNQFGYNPYVYTDWGERLGEWGYGSGFTNYYFDATEQAIYTGDFTTELYYGWGFDLDDTDRVVMNESHFEKIGSDWYSVETTSRWLTNGVDVTTILETTKARLTGLGAGVVSQTIRTNAFQPEFTETVYIDRSLKQVDTLTTSTASSLTATNIAVNGLTESDSTFTVESPTLYYYDDFGRTVKVISPDGYSTFSSFHPEIHDMLLSTTDEANNTTFLEYYGPEHINAGLLKARIEANGKNTYYAYNSRGQATRIWGDVPYPREMVYDEFGDLVEFRTYRGGYGWGSAAWPAKTEGDPDITKWHYDEATGLLVAKEDAHGNKVTHEYDDLNYDPTVRTWARGVAATSTYSSAGDLIAIEYSDSTVEQVFTNYNRIGLPEKIIDASGTHFLSYDAVGRLLSDENQDTGITTLREYHDALGFSKIIVEQDGTNVVEQDYSYSITDGRLETVSSDDHSAVYGYAPDTDRVQTVTFKNGTNRVMTTTKGYQFGMRISSIVNALEGGSIVSSRSYTYDLLNRRAKATFEDGSWWDYTYNNRSELTGAGRKWSDGTPVNGQQFGYLFDNIGNRRSAEKGDSNSTSTYNANALNQYTSRTVPAQTHIAGTADPGATVTVNGNTTTRKGTYYHAALTVDNSSVAVFQSVTNTAVINDYGSEGEDVVDEETGNKFVPRTPEAFQYDADGNLVSDGRWIYGWNGENRIVTMESWPALSDIAKKKLEFEYDYKGRRTSKRVYSFENGGWVLAAEQAYYYDDNNLIAAFDEINNSLAKEYLWGLDRSDSTSSAGGVGGLIMVRDLVGTNIISFPCYGGQGDVLGLVDAATSDVTAKYSYGPFGSLLLSSGRGASTTPFQYSSKYRDSETGLVCYNNRYLDVGNGRWISRDGIGERGGQNLYAFLGNGPINGFDPFGNAAFSRDGGHHVIPVQTLKRMPNGAAARYLNKFQIEYIPSKHKWEKKVRPAGPGGLNHIEYNKAVDAYMDKWLKQNNMTMADFKTERQARQFLRDAMQIPGVKDFNRGVSPGGRVLRISKNVSSIRERYSHAGQGKSALRAGGLMKLAQRGTAAIGVLTMISQSEAIAQNFVRAAKEYRVGATQGDPWQTLAAIDVVIALQMVEGDYFTSMWALDLLLQ